MKTGSTICMPSCAQKLALGRLHRNHTAPPVTPGKPPAPTRLRGMRPGRRPRGMRLDPRALTRKLRGNVRTAAGDALCGTYVSLCRRSRVALVLDGRPSAPPPRPRHHRLVARLGHRRAVGQSHFNSRSLRAEGLSDPSGGAAVDQVNQERDIVPRALPLPPSAKVPSLNGNLVSLGGRPDMGPCA